MTYRSRIVVDRSGLVSRCPSEFRRVRLQGRTRASAEVKSIALAHISELKTKIAELQAMSDTLADACHGDHRLGCSILKDLAGGKEAGAERGKAAAKGHAGHRSAGHGVPLMSGRPR